METRAISQQRLPPSPTDVAGQARNEGLSVVVITNSLRMWMIGMAVSLAIFGLVYFTVIKPSADTANQAVKSGLQQSQQVLNQEQKQLGQAGAVGGTIAGAAQQQLGKASKLASCMTAAGTDLGSVQACQSKYGR
jgi:hypothetical protein